MSVQPLVHADHTIRQIRNADEIRRECLARVIESEIIPRLLVAHRSTASEQTTPSASPSPEDVTAFVELLLADNVRAIHAYLDMWRARGVTVETIFLKLLPDSARRLGALWANDTCGITELTLGMWRLQHLLHELSPVFQSEGNAKRNAGFHVLLSPIGAEQHTFGLSLVGEFFCRAGWEVFRELPVATEQLVETVRTEWFDIFGLWVGSETTMEELTATIASLRQASRNINVGIMVGGSVFIQKPELALSVGADFSACDVIDAVNKSRHYAESMMGASKQSYTK